MIFPIFGQAADLIGYFAIDSTINRYCCGGVMGASMDSAGVGTDFTRRFITTRFTQKVNGLIGTANREGLTLDDCARGLALRNFSRAKKRGEESRLWLGLLALVLYLHSRGLIPRELVRSAFTRYFEKSVLLPSG